MFLAQLILSCTASAAPSQGKIRIDFDFDSRNASNWKNIYVIWLENEEGKIQNLYVCERLLDGSITDYESALPFWHLNRYNSGDEAFREEVDAVTGPTEANRDFSLTAPINESLGENFTLYFEIDQSFNFNDWFPGKAYDMRDQPSVVYAADIDLSDDRTEYDLSLLGFVPMYERSRYGNFSFTTEDQKAYDAGTLTFAKGEIFEEMRYITHGKNTEKGFISFGPEDRTLSAIRSVAAITATVEKK